MKTLLLALLLATPTLANEITSISPTSGPTAGGTTVTIKGDFDSKLHFVRFGSMPAQPVFRTDPHTLIVVTPPHLPGGSQLNILDGSQYKPMPVTFTFEGPVAGFETILLPVFTYPVRGAFGSEFHTELRASTKHRAVHIFGLEPDCAPVICIGWNPADNAIELLTITPDDVPRVLFSVTPGRLIYVPTEEAHALSANLRVHDVTRADLNFGTEMPIPVFSRDFTTPIVLHGVPLDPRFRKTLRIYATQGTLAIVTIEGQQPVIVEVVGAEGLFTPAYAQFTDFPIGEGKVKVTIDTPARPTSPPIQTPVWAFITVTNNETQMITTITPQP